MTDAVAPGRGSAAHVFVDDITAPVLGEDDHRHLLRVLRLRTGEAVSVADGTGWWRPCRLAGDGALEPTGDAIAFAAPSPTITVAMAVPKGDRPEWAVQKLTELGVDRIVVLAAERGVVRWDGERAGRHLDRLAAVARAAAMQSRRLTLPAIEGPTTLASLVSSARSASSGSLASSAPSAPSGSLAGGSPVVLAEPGGGPPSLAGPTIAIGPEGGWSAGELALDLPRVSLAPTILRSETAAVVAATLLVALRSYLVTPRGAR
jgi:16S rRNA (uracil1498-N3)-methyltransferase